VHIDDYSFGRIVINNEVYTSDVIIYPDRVDASWWRKQGHYLQEDDLKDILIAQPDTLIVGTGYSGIMQVPKKTRTLLESKNIAVYIEKTGAAAELFNRISKKKAVIAAFHLTC
jgi:hypothetical protein